MVLLSQRRRWINSTIHNLMELLFVHDLCGTFCFSMQFVIFMELVGTLALPAAISFTLYLVVMACLGQPSLIPLILLALILGLPAVLIVMTSRKIVYVGWMLVYLISLPIWNFVLPVYAYWHFDDFSWGDTRKVAGVANKSDKKGGHADKSGEFDSSVIVMKKWSEYEKERRTREALDRNLPVPRFMDRPGSTMDVFRDSVNKRTSKNSAGSNDSDAPLTAGYTPERQINHDLAIQVEQQHVSGSGYGTQNQESQSSHESVGPDIPLTMLHRNPSQESFQRITPRANYNAALAMNSNNFEDNHDLYNSMWSDPAPHHHQQQTFADDEESDDNDDSLQGTRPPYKTNIPHD